MRIKKYQKIICLGLTLLSIMVLPCYSLEIDTTVTENINILRYYYNEESNDWKFDTLEEAYVSEFNISLPKELRLVYDRSYFYESYPKSFLGVSKVQQNFYIGIICKENAGNIIVTDHTHNRNAEFIYSTDTITIDDLNVHINIYKFSADTLYFDEMVHLNIYGCRFGIISDADIGYLNQYILFTEVDEVVLNITSYTNLLIQNFGKAFSFMTGPALPWVLLGITVSLITFGIYNTKRII